MNIKIKKLSPTAKIPTLGSPDAAGYDLYADIPEAVWIPGNSARKIGTGIAMEIPKGYGAFLVPRSGLACNYGVRLSNCVGLGDPDYRGEYKISLRNDTDEGMYVGPGERIAQLCVIKCERLEFEEVDELSDTIRGENGFGSTGK